MCMRAHAYLEVRLLHKHVHQRGFAVVQVADEGDVADHFGMIHQTPQEPVCVVCVCLFVSCVVGVARNKGGAEKAAIYIITCN